ncbi:DUF559 domain-containing protein [Rhizobiaceae bacterium]|nr:DUF559 domain-containing protein [Rhizobiaceae bacterium]
MPTAIPKPSIARARRIRAEPTNGERSLWSALRTFRAIYGIHLRRQVPIGPYVVDFACHHPKLVIELDGELHFTADGQQKDALRDAWLAQSGYRVHRMTTAEWIANPDGCIESLLADFGKLT